MTTRTRPSPDHHVPPTHHYHITTTTTTTTATNAAGTVLKPHLLTLVHWARLSFRPIRASFILSLGQLFSPRPVHTIWLGTYRFFDDNFDPQRCTPQRGRQHGPYRHQFLALLISPSISLFQHTLVSSSPPRDISPTASRPSKPRDPRHRNQSPATEPSRPCFLFFCS